MRRNATGAAQPCALEPYHRHHTTLYLPDDTTETGVEVRAIVAIVGYTPAEPGSAFCPPADADYEIDVRDRHDQPRPDWAHKISLYELAAAAGADWQASLDDDEATAQVSRAETHHEDAVNGTRIGRVWV